MNTDDLLAHLKAEIGRLTTLHRAEQEHNRRLYAACSLYRSAACEGLAMVREAEACTDSESVPHGDSLASARKSICTDIDKADAIVLPTAG